MKRSNIILTGFMGCGKTTVGKIVAQELDYDFVDTDHLIEKRCGQSVRLIFSSKGEKYFRKREAETARELGEKEGMVISTGGGMMLRDENVAALCASGHVFCLVATPEEILQRISKDSIAKRPLLNSPDPLKRIINLMQQREKIYKQFNQISTSNKSPQKIAQQLITIFQSFL